MESLEFLSGIKGNALKIVLTIFLVFAYLIFTKVVANLIKKYGKRQDISLSRVVYTTKYFRFISFVFCLLVLGMTWDITFKGLSVYFLSFFTVAGIGLFASWSILSNITAAIILFFYFPFRIGQRVKIIDGDNSIEGILFDLNLFSIVIKNDEGQKVTYPNNLALQKGIVQMKE